VSTVEVTDISKQTAASGFRVQISYIAYSKHEHAAIMEYYNLNCKCPQYRHPKKQNLSLTTSNQEPSNVKKKKYALTESCEIITEGMLNIPFF
jgi:hypothetical protein